LDDEIQVMRSIQEACLTAMSGCKFLRNCYIPFNSTYAPRTKIFASNIAATGADITEQYGMVKDEAFYKHRFKDVPALCGQTCVFLAAGKWDELRDFILIQGKMSQRYLQQEGEFWRVNN
jgi:hypothetical protein